VDNAARTDQGTEHGRIAVALKDTVPSSGYRAPQLCEKRQPAFTTLSAERRLCSLLTVATLTTR